MNRQTSHKTDIETALYAPTLQLCPMLKNDSRLLIQSHVIDNADYIASKIAPHFPKSVRW